jgi:hypothetical protein
MRELYFIPGLHTTPRLIYRELREKESGQHNVISIEFKPQSPQNSTK